MFPGIPSENRRSLITWAGAAVQTGDGAPSHPHSALPLAVQGEPLGLQQRDPSRDRQLVCALLHFLKFLCNTGEREGGGGRGVGREGK